MPRYLFYLLLPFSWLYGSIIHIRKLLYRSGIYNRSSFDFPIICVGNLTAGGTGKTPHIEWLIKTLREQYKVAVLSRGYKRKTTGYQLASISSNPEQIGDEPFQISRKFPTVPVAVSENRVLGVPALLGDVPDTQVILMDDGFQHLSIKPGFNIVLCDYNRPYYDDHLLPAGLLREPASGAARADLIIVTKCPATISADEKNMIRTKLKPLSHQHVFFSTIIYHPLVPLTQAAATIALPDKTSTVIALSGIAKPAPFTDHLATLYREVIPMIFSDHQDYTESKISKILDLAGETKEARIITTEKDAVKLSGPGILPAINHLPVWYQPVGVEILDGSGNQLMQLLVQYITDEQRRSSETD